MVSANSLMKRTMCVCDMAEGLFLPESFFNVLFEMLPCYQQCMLTYQDGIFLWNVC